MDAALITLGAIWSGVFVVFPLFNRDRRRLGDLAAGSMVVKASRRVLRPDLADAERTVSRSLVFTPAQLDAYGVKELHVLEDVLRANNRKSLAEVATRIRVKINWQGADDLPDLTFLNAYYTGLRGRLRAGCCLDTGARTSSTPDASGRAGRHDFRPEFSNSKAFLRRGRQRAGKGSRTFCNLSLRLRRHLSHIARTQFVSLCENDLV